MGKRMVPAMRKPQRATSEEAFTVMWSFCSTSNSTSSHSHVDPKFIRLQNPRSPPVRESIAKLRHKDTKWTHHSQNCGERGKNSTFFSLWVCTAVWLYTYSHKKKGGVCLKMSQDFFLQYDKWCGKYPFQLLWDKLQHDQSYGSDEHKKLPR